ncbi:MAG: hypothetical protein F9K19_11715 [Rhizobiaceae bacterium]|nr:MAG: hypothetical protein F9K19_11715 [Rhizobiaceae bacterium]CAG1000755.1 hypothetical protein RHIZO_02812 [Rhizobiaceae bacterium]
MSPGPIGPVIALLGAVVFVGALVRAARNRFRSGAGPGPIHCPKCGEIVPAAQARPSTGQAIRDGFICKACGQSMDKWGRARGR